MGKNRDTNLMIVLILISMVIVNISVFYLYKKYEVVSESSSPRNNHIPKLIFKLEEGKPWGKLKEPMNVVTFRGKIFVSDTGNSRVLAFNMNGKYLFDFEKGVKKADRRLSYPYGLATDSSGNIYISDLEAGRVLIYNEEGKFIRYFNEDNKYLVKPAGIFVRDDRVYITDLGFHKVYVFNKNGQLLLTIGSGKIGSANDELYYPNAVTADLTGKIYISDSINNRIQVFSKEGKYLQTIGGNDGLKLINPRGIALDYGGNIFVSSTMNNSIKAVDKDGMFIFDMVSGIGYSFSLPVGVHIDQFDNLYIADRGNNQVLVFKR